MPIFPSNPNNNDEHTLGSRKFKFDSTKGLWKLFDASSAAVTGGSSTTLATAIDHKTYTATDGQTTFAVTYSGDDVIVSRNGIKLTPDEYTASNGTSVVLSVGCNVNDAVDCVGFTTAEAGGSSVTASDTAPTSPSEGDMWFNSAVLKTYVYYSGTWVVANPSGTSTGGGSSITAYTNLAAFPSSDNTVGDMGFTEDTKALYVWDGTEWDRIQSGSDEDPDWVTEPNTTYPLAKDGTALTVTVEASDPDGFGITYDYDTSPSDQSQATIVNNNDGSFTFTPSTTQSDAGEFTMRFKATDGLNVIRTLSTMKLSFSDNITFKGGTQVSSFNGSVDRYFQNPGVDGTADDPLKEGSWYIESTIHSLASASFVGGVCGYENNLDERYYGSNNQVQLYSNGSVYYGGNTAALGTVSAGDIIGIAINTSTGKIWFSKNGTWNGDPAAGTGGFQGPSGSTVYYTYTNGSSSGSSAISTTLHHGDNINSLVYTPPAGFSAY